MNESVNFPPIKPQNNKLVLGYFIHGTPELCLFNGVKWFDRDENELIEPEFWFEIPNYYKIKK